MAAVAGVEIGLLGPVELRVGGEPAPLPAGKLPAVLAMLALRLGRCVTSEELIAAIWQDPDVPVTATGQLHTCVWRLRRLLGDLIESCHRGYRLTEVGVTVDVRTFERHLADGRAAAAAGRQQEASESFQAGLALWRGPALTDLPALAGAAAGLEERRLAAEEGRIDCDLARGLHRDAVVALTSLVADHPLHEDLHGRLMVALYRSGRTAEALEVYHQVRLRLRTDLGVDPGIGLQRLRQHVLTQDDALAPPLPSSEPTSQARSTGHGDSTAAPVTLARQRVHGPLWQRHPPAPVHPSFFGVTLNSTSGQMPGFGVGAVRLWDCECRWANIEPRKRGYEWATLDRLVDGARTADLPVLYTMGMPAAWASPGSRRTPYVDDSRAGPPADLEDWSSYVHATVTRYRGRIEAYELWDYVNVPNRYSGSATVLIDMVDRAAKVIKAEDPAALVVSPSFGDLWDPAARDRLRELAEAGLFEHCDAAAIKLHPRHADGPPEEMIELANLVDRTLHGVGAQRPLWATGPAHDMVNAPRLSQQAAGAHAVRHFLACILAQVGRTYFYNWGNRNIPIVLQAEGGPPTEAALFVEQVQRWLAGAHLQSGSHGTDDGLPPNVWRLRLLSPPAADAGSPGRAAQAIVWTDTGEARMPAEPGMHSVEHLDGSTEPVDPGGSILVTELPVLIRCRPGP